MRFSASQWLVLIAADFVFRVLLFVVFSFHFMFVPLSFCISVIHLTIFGLVNIVVSYMKLQDRYAAYFVVILSNAIFLAAFIFTWVSFIRVSQQTVCVSYPDNCEWIQGKILLRGVAAILEIAAIQVVANVTPLLFTRAIFSRRVKSPKLR